MSWEEITRAVYDMIVSSSMVIDGINWREVSKYVAVMVPQEEFQNLGLGLVIPKRKKRRTRIININCLRQKNHDNAWTVARKPGARQKHVMIALAVSIGVKHVMSNPTYVVGDTYYLQTIGLELTGAVCHP